jgi:hypothetical protein
MAGTSIRGDAKIEIGSPVSGVWWTPPESLHRTRCAVCASRSNLRDAVSARCRDTAFPWPPAVWRLIDPGID